MLIQVRIQEHADYNEFKASANTYSPLKEHRVPNTYYFRSQVKTNRGSIRLTTTAACHTIL
jgi:hypothetical protein